MVACVLRKEWVGYCLLYIIAWSTASALINAADTSTLTKASDSKEKLWSLEPVRRPSIPQTKSKEDRNPVDYFIAAKIQEAGLTPSPEADRVTLLRRLSFDLLGLPPTPEEIETFKKDRAPDAYKKLV